MPGQDSRILVLGGGISGLAAARELQARGFEPLVIEACPSLGGLTRTVHVDDFCFDYTGHFLHLAQHRTPAALPHADLKDENWQRIERRAYAYLGGRLVPAPVQYHLGALPEPLRSECVRDFERRSGIPPEGAASFREWVVGGFGASLANGFLIPQNEKTMAVNLDRLSQEAVRRFFPPPDAELVRNGIIDAGVAAPTYNSKFWYPKLGGIDRLTNGLARGVAVRCLEKAVELDLDSRVVRCESGRTWSWDRLLSSIPLKRLCQITTDPVLRSSAEKMSHSSTISFSIGLRGPLPAFLGDAQWIYVPDRSLPFYRVGMYSNISRGLCPPDRAALYVEVGVDSDGLPGLDIAGDLQPRVMRTLGELGWAPSERVVCSVTHVIECAYVHHTHDVETGVSGVISSFENHSVFPIGRYGRWDYVSIEDSILSGIEGANRALA